MWTVQPVDERQVAEFTVAVPAELVPASASLARRLGVAPGAVLLASHAKVVSSLDGDDEVLTGYLGDSAIAGLRSVPCRLTVPDGSWRQLIQAADRALPGGAGYLALSQGAAQGTPPFGTVIDLSDLTERTPGRARSATAAGLGAGIALWTRFSWRGRRPGLTLRYLTGTLDAEFAARIAGYYLTALELMTGEPDASHRARGLITEDERRFQLDSLRGVVRELPDRRMHELFEAAAQRHPDAVAATCRGEQVTYAELNRQANRLGRALLARRPRAQEVVGVVAERNLRWMAAVLAIFKAGCAYLPIEPGLPAQRIAAMITRSGCQIILAETGRAANLDQALSAAGAAPPVLIEEALREAHDDADLGTRVAADHLAYVIFTSGSTGEPKGAMCEHAGLLNHLLAKVEDLGLRADDVVAQTAPLCFDISIWQLLAALLVGGRALIVEQEAILDVRRFADTLIDGEVAVAQLVPSYLAALLTHLEEQPRPAGLLRRMSVTGEALPKELVVRWFASYPDIPLVNAYGLTETSDDTNHEIMHGVPAETRIALGRPVRNVMVTIVDSTLRLVPLGAPGEIVFSGVCVGRGYINDSQRTRAAFGPDPHRPGQRMYRSGDIGRWRQDGRLEFLGRRDAQVKIRGFRIEIGEIENHLLRMAGIRDAAVVVAERPADGPRLVAFYAGFPSARPAPADSVRAFLATSLPEYMIPASFHPMDALPLNQNGKIDRLALGRLAAEAGRPGEQQPAQAPRTPTESRVATAWSAVLGIAGDQVGRADNFFESGGTSLSAVRLVLRLGQEISLLELTQHPVLADLAALIDDSTAVAGRPAQAPGELTGRRA